MQHHAGWDFYSLLGKSVSKAYPNISAVDQTLIAQLHPFLPYFLL
jgi:hypothetical protein